MADHSTESSFSSSYSAPSCREFTLSEIELATHNFDESRLLGKGGFAKVYRGTITYDERRLDVAIKRLIPRPGSSEEEANKYWYEVAMLYKLRHPHLVSQIGYCSDGQEMIFVYEYLPHGTLYDRLHKGGVPLSWMRRLKICLETARGLEYLHSETDTKSKVLHLDVKSSNILLASTWAAKLSDFGMSKVRPVDSTYVTDHVGGTHGYLDPEYQLTGEATRKTDVYAFGVIMFEVLCGKKAVYRSIDNEPRSLARWAQDSIKEGRLEDIIDPNLKGRISSKCLNKFALLADRCLCSHPEQRPIIDIVLKNLESILALQKKDNDRVLINFFGKRTSNEENSVAVGVGVASLKSLDRYLYFVGGEDQVLHRFNSNVINQATGNFSESNKLLSHSHIYIYKGMLQNGQAITIAKYIDVDYEYFMNDALVLAKLEHENVIKLLGYCIGKKNQYLVYDFAANATLLNLLCDPRGNVLDQNKLYKIILGVARGLVYLHNHAPVPIIHADLKPKNILLDESFEPKLSGFAFAKKINDNDAVKVDQFRLPEYQGPELDSSKGLTTKSDVYSFGVLILNIVTERRAIHDGVWLVPHVRKNWLEGTLSNIIDPIIDSILTTNLIQIGLLCCRDSYRDRPTMLEVVGMLIDTSTLPGLELEPWMNRVTKSRWPFLRL